MLAAGLGAAEPNEVFVSVFIDMSPPSAFPEANILVPPLAAPLELRAPNPPDLAKPAKPPDAGAGVAELPKAPVPEFAALAKPDWPNAGAEEGGVPVDAVAQGDFCAPGADACPKALLPKDDCPNFGALKAAAAPAPPKALDPNAGVVKPADGGRAPQGDLFRPSVEAPPKLPVAAAPEALVPDEPKALG